MRRIFLHGLLLICLCVAISASPWFHRPPPPPPPPPYHPPGPLIPDALRADLIRNLASLHLAEKLHDSRHRAKRLRVEKLRRSANPLVFTSMGNIRSPHLDDHTAIDDYDELPIVIQKIPPKPKETALSKLAVLDSTPIDVEALHLIQRLLKGLNESKKMKKRKALIDGKAHHIIITQGPSETVTSIQAPVNACVPMSNDQNGIGGTPRAAAPVGNPQPPAPNLGTPQPQPQPTPNQPNQFPAAVTPVQQTPEFGGPAQPLAELPVSNPSNPNPMNPMNIATTFSQTLLGTDQEHMGLLQPSMPTVSPVLAELGALLLGAQPALGFTDVGHGHHQLGHVKLAQPALAAPAALALHVPTKYEALLPVSQTQSTSSITTQLLNLITSLQEQREIQRQQLEQQQQLQQAQQDLLQQQRNQLAQMQQQPQTPAVQPQLLGAQPQQPGFPNPTDQQGRSVFPTGAGDQSAFPTTTNPVTNPTTMDVLQQLLQPGSSSSSTSMVSSIPQAIITVTTDDEDTPTNPLGYRTIKTFRKRKKYFTHEFLPKKPFLY